MYVSVTKLYQRCVKRMIIYLLANILDYYCQAQNEQTSHNTYYELYQRCEFYIWPYKETLSII